MPDDKVAITIRKEDVQTLNDSTIIKNKDIANALIQHQGNTLVGLSQEFEQITLEDIGIDDNGNIVIKNQKFTESAQNKLDEAQGLIIVNIWKCGT